MSDAHDEPDDALVDGLLVKARTKEWTPITDAHDEAAKALFAFAGDRRVVEIQVDASSVAIAAALRKAAADEHQGRAGGLPYVACGIERAALEHGNRERVLSRPRSFYRRGDQPFTSTREGWRMSDDKCRCGHDRICHPYANACRAVLIDCECQKYLPPGLPKPQSIAALTAELLRARAKFPGNAKLTVALMEEVGELAQALLQGKPKDEIVKEALQVACVAIRIAEEGDSDFASDKEWSKLK